MSKEKKGSKKPLVSKSVAAGKPAPPKTSKQQELKVIPQPPDKTPKQKKLEAALRKDWARLYKERRNVRDVLRRHHDRLIARPDVTGLHVGLRRKKGEIVFPLKYSICVDVRHKLPEDDPKLINKLESKIEGVDVDVTEARYSHVEASAAEGRFVSTIEGGIPILGNSIPPKFGTLGKVVFDPTGNALYLTNQHVVDTSGPVVQPPNRSTPAGENPVIGTVSDSQWDDVIDAAVVQPNDRPWAYGIVDPDGQELEGILIKGPALSSSDVHVTQCFKVGAVTGGSRDVVGIVDCVDYSIQIDGVHPMINQIRVMPPEGVDPSVFIDHGDSGSLLLVPTQQSGVDFNLAVGLVHAKEDVSGALIACHLDRVFERFSISLKDS